MLNFKILQHFNILNLFVKDKIISLKKNNK